MRINRDVVLKYLGICGHGDCSVDCPYFKYEPGHCHELLMLDALYLLKCHKAEWVEYNYSIACRIIKCSNCGLRFIVGNNVPYDEWITEHKYCRRCGAWMGGKNNVSDHNE